MRRLDRALPFRFVEPGQQRQHRGAERGCRHIAQPLLQVLAELGVRALVHDGMPFV